MPDDKPPTSSQGQQGGTEPPPNTDWAKTEQVRKERGADVETRQDK